MEITQTTLDSAKSRCWLVFVGSQEGLPAGRVLSGGPDAGSVDGEGRRAKRRYSLYRGGGHAGQRAPVASKTA